MGRRLRSGALAPTVFISAIMSAIALGPTACGSFGAAEPEGGDAGSVSTEGGPPGEGGGEVSAPPSGCAGVSAKDLLLCDDFDGPAALTKWEAVDGIAAQVKSGLSDISFSKPLSAFLETLKGPDGSADSRFKNAWPGNYEKFELNLRMRLEITTPSATIQLARIQIGDLDDVVMRSDGALLVRHRPSPAAAYEAQTVREGSGIPQNEWFSIVLSLDVTLDTATMKINGDAGKALPGNKTPLSLGDVTLLLGPQEPSVPNTAWRVLIDDVIARGTTE